MVPGGDKSNDQESCVVHPFETADRVCHDCGHWHCDSCLVSPWGPRKPALCVTCALARSGVRQSAGIAPVRSAAEIRRIEKNRKRDEKAAGRRPVVTPKGLGRPLPPPSVDPVAEPPERRGLLRRLRPT